MNFDEAIQAHSSWKMRLTSYLRQPDGSLKANEVSADNRCALGQWLHGEGRKFANTPEYKRLVADHARFHRAAGSVVAMAQTGKNTTEQTALGSSSEYGEASRNVVSALMAMKKLAVKI